MRKTVDNDAASAQGSSVSYIPKIVSYLQQMEVARIILFGSQARGEATETSDLDLIVVTASDQMPATYREKEAIYLAVARLLRDIRREAPIDLIVHTRPMHARFIEMDSLFAREVQQKGVVLYELIRPLHPVIADLDMLDRLESVYIEARYPGDMGLLPTGRPSQEEAAEFFSFARDVFNRLSVNLEDVETDTDSDLASEEPG